MSWSEILICAGTAVNAFMVLTIRNEVLKLELRIVKRLADEFLTTKDFERWTRRSNMLPNYTGDK